MKESEIQRQTRGGGITSETSPSKKAWKSSCFESAWVDADLREWRRETAILALG